MGFSQQCISHHISIGVVTAMMILFILNSAQSTSQYQVMPEICNNAIDDDGDGLADLNDTDCDCPLLQPVSLIANPSFEDQDCCPNDRSQLNCAQGWTQASEPTTDYIHTCGWIGLEDILPPTPYPDGDGIMGFRDGRSFSGGGEPNWKEYAGTCLLSPLKANVRYRFEFFVGFVDNETSPPIDITFFGSENCANLPFGFQDEEFGCPTNGPDWQLLGSRKVRTIRNQGAWIKTTIDVRPNEDIFAIAIGPPCAATASMVNTYYYFDNLLLADLRSFEFVITPINHPCSADFNLQVPEESGLDYQWYKEGIALTSETSPKLSQTYGEGDYQVRVTGDGQCKITKTFNYKIPIRRAEAAITICNNDSYRFGNNTLNSSGMYTTTFTSNQGCDSIVELQLNILEDLSSTVEGYVFEGEDYNIGSWSFRSEGTHRAVETSSIGCDSTITVQLKYYNTYQANIFSPNGDNSNDYFTIAGDTHLLDITSLVIYDRWGGELYNQTNLMTNNLPGWDGTYQSREVNPGAYAYVAKVLMDDMKERTVMGSIVLIR